MSERMIETACIECGAAICLPETRYDYLLRTKRVFYCSAGHPQSFMGEKITQETVNQLRAQVERFRDRWNAELDKAWAYRQLSRTCPFGCGFKVHGSATREATIRGSISGHLVEAHGARPGVLLALTEKAGR